MDFEERSASQLAISSWGRPSHESSKGGLEVNTSCTHYAPDRLYLTKMT